MCKKDIKMPQFVGFIQKAVYIYFSIYPYRNWATRKIPSL